MKRITIISLLILFCLCFVGCRKEKDWYIRYAEFVEKYDYELYEFGDSFDYSKTLRCNHVEWLDSIPDSTHEYAFLVLNLERKDVSSDLIFQISNCIHEKKYTVIYTHFSEYYDILKSSTEDILGDTGNTSMTVPDYSSVDYKRKIGIDGISEIVNGNTVVSIIYDMIRMSEGLI